MNRVLKVLGWACGVSFTVFMLATLYKSGGNKLPDDVEHYRSLFQNGLEWFLSSSLFGVFFIAMWIGVSFHMSRASGWKKLSEHFSNKCLSFVEPLAYTTTSGKFGEIFHNGMLKVGFSDSGIVLKVMLPFRIGHPPLYLPWNRIENIKIQKSRATKNSALRKVAEFISPFKYANIRLIGYPDQVILVSWKEVFRKNIPHNVMSNNGDF